MQHALDEMEVLLRMAAAKYGEGTSNEPPIDPGTLGDAMTVNENKTKCFKINVYAPMSGLVDSQARPTIVSEGMETEGGIRLVPATFMLHTSADTAKDVKGKSAEPVEFTFMGNKG